MQCLGNWMAHLWRPLCELLEFEVFQLLGYFSSFIILLNRAIYNSRISLFETFIISFIIISALCHFLVSLYDLLSFILISRLLVLSSIKLIFIVSLSTGNSLLLEVSEYNSLKKFCK